MLELRAPWDAILPLLLLLVRARDVQEVGLEVREPVVVVQTFESVGAGFEAAAPEDLARPGVFELVEFLRGGFEACDGFFEGFEVQACAGDFAAGFARGGGEGYLRVGAQAFDV